MTPQLSLFAADRYHDPRIAADRARARALAKLRPVRRCDRSELRAPISLDDVRVARAAGELASGANRAA